MGDNTDRRFELKLRMQPITRENRVSTDCLLSRAIFQHQPDLAIGVHLMDRYTFYLLEFLEDIHPASKTNMNDLVRMFVYKLVYLGLPSVSVCF